MEIVERIKNLLRDAGIADKKMKPALADACGVSYQAVAQWFDGKTKKISPDHLAAIAKTWRTTTDYLITGRKPPTIPEAVEYDELSEAQKIAVKNLIRDLHSEHHSPSPFQQSAGLTQRANLQEDS